MPAIYYFVYRLYLDNCIFNRQFDDQSAERVRNETEAVLKILAEIESHNLSLAWSYMNEAENVIVLDPIAMASKLGEYEN